MGKAKKQSKRKKRDVVIYNKAQYSKDEKMFEAAMSGKGVVDWTSFKRLMIHDLCCDGIIDTHHVGSFKLEDILFAIDHPGRNGKLLMDVSSYLMRASPHYYRLNMFYSNISSFCWWLDIYDVKDTANMQSLIKIYDTLSVKLENMNLKHEFAKIMTVLPYKDIYCGLVVESSTDFFIQEVDFSICKLKKVQDGLYNFVINLAGIKPCNRLAYPDYVQRAMDDFNEGRADSPWYMPPAEKQICIKMNAQVVYPMPMLMGLARDIFDLDTYKNLKLQRARTDNYKAIASKVPIDEKSVDKPLLTDETLGVFAEINKGYLPEDVGLIYTLGSDAKAISFQNSTETRNNVSDAVDELYNSSGITQEAFNGSASGTAVTFSIENDSGFIYRCYRQFERWVNRYIKLNKYNKPAFKFMFYLLDATTLNKDKIVARYKDACMAGISAKGQYLAALDMTPSRTKGSFIMEQQVFDFQKNFIPLSTSYTQSSSDTGGRPTNESKGEELTESGEQTQDNESNSKR